ncbi:hypothetical protein [Cellvibrio sp. UBA7671]|uniref:hypothetical protein n=1 Tax=Cellvibrio sp. UBA7671 TaxID=1946312 RepID=UPI002F3577F5
MRKSSDVTEAELKKAYDETPAVNQYVPWAEVQANHVFKTLLINQIIAHEEDQTMQKMPTNNGIFLAIDNGDTPPAFIGLDAATNRDATVISTAPESKKITRRSTITLHEKQIEKIRNAVILGRNCLRSGHVNDLLRSEALSDLAEAQKILQSFYEPRV